MPTSRTGGSHDPSSGSATRGQRCPHCADRHADNGQGSIDIQIANHTFTVVVTQFRVIHHTFKELWMFLLSGPELIELVHLVKYRVGFRKSKLRYIIYD